ncbi:MAG: beta-propeller fold lactonase family protein [Nocardioides sp.]|uniref:lactonase family protein n=1 Tax=Nocardioides sp. TaxID=35761 RepID=UPI0039E49B4F
MSIRKVAVMARRASYAYVGNWRIDATGYGVTICDFDEASGALTPRRTVHPEISVGCLHLDAARNRLYVADERSDNPDIGPGGGGRIYAFAIDPGTGDLRELNHVSSHGALASYVTTDPTGRYLIATNHARPATVTVVRRDGDRFTVDGLRDRATTVLFELTADGSVGRARDVFTHPVGETGFAHAHCAVRSPDGELYAVCDKGTDRIYLFRIDADRGALVPVDPAGTPHPTGAAPRYCAFHPRLRTLYVNSESAPVLVAYSYDESGRLATRAEVDVLPGLDGRAMPEQASDLLIDAAGRYLYNLVRGVDRVVVLELDEQGTPHLVQSLELGLDNPRGGTLSPDGDFLLVGCVGDTEVVTLAVGDDGRLTPTGVRMPAKRPGCLVIHRPTAATTERD